MARAVTIGNGNLLVGLDDYGHVRDFYYPYAGYANHVSGSSGSYSHRVGVWADGSLDWLTSGNWNTKVRCHEETVISDIRAENNALGVSLHMNDAVHNEKDVFLRKVIIKNTHDTEREIKIFFGQEFRIQESRRGNTAFFDPRVNAVIHYKGHTAFLVNALSAGEQFSEYSIGIFDIEGKSGTYMDAEDGKLSKNPIEHGSVDSVIGFSFSIPPQGEQEVYYWIVAGDSIESTHTHDAYIRSEKPERLLESTKNYWKAWLEKEERNLSIFDADLQTLYRQSLAIIRVHTDNRGGIIASSDSEMLNHGRDFYSYVWPRDSAIIANALDRAGYKDAAQRYFSFISDRIESGGYLMHKYQVDGALGSSWHPWVRNGKTELPIQEDETALSVYMLSKHFEYAKDVEFIESLYNPFVEPAADFMCTHIDEESGLPKESYDLWEEKYGVSTYTASAVFGALRGAADLSSLLGKRDNAKKYMAAAERMQQAILGELYDIKLGMFVKLLREVNGKTETDCTVDMSSFHGVSYFGVLMSGDKRLVRAFEIVRERLHVPTDFGGYMRYEEDQYYRTSKHAPPNAWCITTLWMAQYIVKSATTKKELREAYDLLRWIYDRARKSGVLPEQIHPYDGSHLSAAPLTWSHAEYVITVDEYLKRYNSLS